MMPISRIEGVVARVLTALLLCAPITAGRVHAAADSTGVESAPGRLIVPPSAPALGVPPTSAATTREDTALVSRRRKAREDFGRGLMLEEQHAYAAAILSYTNAARLDPTLRGPSYRIGLLYASRQQYDPAARAFREELRRDPDNRAARREFALTLAELGDTTRSVRMLEELTRRAPGDAVVWRSLGFVYGRAGRHAAAEKALRGAVGLDPKFARAWRDLGVILAAQGKSSEARTAYRRALQLDPGDEAALINLGNLESRDGDHEQALVHYRAAERRDSTQALAYRGQISELVALGREADAGAVWRRWLAVAEGDAEVREGAARHFIRQGRTDIALQLARDSIRRKPDSGEAWWLLGEILGESGDLRAALDAYRRASKGFTTPADLARAEESIRAIRATAPDSLRAWFTADSAAAARPGGATSKQR